MILLDNLSKSYGSRAILKNVSYHFPQGQRIALVGANGAGKSTLLNIIAGIELVDEGRVIRPGDLSLGYLPQEPNPEPAGSVLAETVNGDSALLKHRLKLEEALKAMEDDASEQVIEAYGEAEDDFRRAGGYAIEGKAAAILAGLGFSEQMLRDSPLNLSGGWRMRVELAKLLLRAPDFLILDEPTNHLDLPSLIFVEKFLFDFKGTLLFVSHDRSLLDRLATRTISLRSAQIFETVGNFTSHLEQMALREEQLDAQRSKLEQRREEMERFVDRFGAKASKASQAQSRVKMIEKIRESEAALPETQSERVVKFKMADPPKSGRMVLVVEALQTGYQGEEPKILSDGIKLEIERGWKIAIIGANGLGKSTFLKTVAGMTPAISGSVNLGANVALSYFAQDQRDAFETKLTVLENIVRLGQNDTNQARGLLGKFMFSGDDIHKPFEVLSGGEKSRLGLAALFASKANFLLLDEPTNHLDMASIERLKDALGEFAGTMMYVSHDRDFIDAFCTHIFVLLPDRKHFLIEGNLADALRCAAQIGYPNLAPKTEDSSDNKKAVKKQPPQEESKAKGTSLSKERKKLEEEISILQKDKSKTEAAMSRVHADQYGELTKLQKDLEQITEALATKEERLLEIYEAEV